MAISATINAAFNINNSVYNASLSIPSAAPTAADPFTFKVTSTPTGGTTTTSLLTVAVGASGEVYVAVQPPMDVISSAVGSDIVQTLNVVVSEGTYNTATGTFS